MRAGSSEPTPRTTARVLAVWTVALIAAAVQLASMFFDRALSQTAEGYWSTYRPEIYNTGEFGSQPKMTAFDFTIEGPLELALLIATVATISTLALRRTQAPWGVRVVAPVLAVGLAILALANVLTPGLGAMDFEVYPATYVAAAAALAQAATVAALLHLIPAPQRKATDDPDLPWINGVPPGGAQA
jgi:hypothetical protein